MRNPYAILQVIALRVNSNPTPTMIRVINEVEEWALNNRLRFAKFAENSGPQTKELLTQHAMALCDRYVTNEEFMEDSSLL